MIQISGQYGDPLLRLIAERYGNPFLRLTAVIQPINDIIYYEIPPEDREGLFIINHYINEDCDTIIANIMLALQKHI